MAEELIRRIPTPAPVWPEVSEIRDRIRLAYNEKTDILTIRFSDGPSIGVDGGGTVWVHIDPESGLVRAVTFEDFEAVVVKGNLKLKEEWTGWKRLQADKSSQDRKLLRELVPVG